MKNDKKSKDCEGQNPFFCEDIILRDKGEKLIMSQKEKDKIKELTEKVLDKDEHNILILVGRAGAGKKPVEIEISKNLPEKYEKREFIFGIDIINELRCITTDKYIKENLFIFLDNMELSEAFGEEKLKKVIELIIETSRAGVCYVLSCDPETLARMYSFSGELSRKSFVYNVPGLSFEIAKELVVSRLNRFRDEESDSLEPFTEAQIKNIWQTSKGNPRMILMLCGNLYSILKS